MHKEILQIIRDPRTFITALVNPLMMLFLFGYGLSTDIKNVRLGVVDWSHTRQSRDLHRAFTSSGYFLDAFSADRYEELGKALDDRRIQLGLVIPANFAQRTAAGRAAAVQIIVDGSDPTTATTVSGYASAIVAGYSNSVLEQVVQRHGIVIGANAMTIDVRPRVWYNEDLLSIDFIVPGVIVIVLMMTTASLTASTVARERERGSIEQIVVSPVKPYELMVGKTAAYVLLALLDVTLVVIIGHFWFGVPIKGSLLLFSLCSLLFITSSLGIGLLASAGAKTQRGAQTSVMLLTMLPGIILSGFVFPISSMPAGVQVFTWLIPARYFMVIVRGIFLKGTGFVDLWPQIWPLALLCCVLMGASIATFKKRL
ncbi:MAG: ABC transporter permease [Fimbriimonadales bacterium]